MKKFIYVFMMSILFLSCVETDKRLNGVFINETRYSTEEIEFKNNNLKINKKYSNEVTRSANEEEFEYIYKIKIISKNDNGGTFYAIDDFYSDTEFNDTSKRKVIAYTFYGLELILEDNSKPERDRITRYTRK